MDHYHLNNKKSILLILITLIGYGISYVFNLLLSHTLSDGLYGNFNLGLRTLSIVSFFILLGTANSAKRFLSAYLAENDYSSSSDYIHWNLKLIWRNSILFIACLAALLIIIIALHLFQAKDIASYHITIYLLFIAPITALSTLVASYLECNDNIIIYNLLNYIKYLLFIALILGVIYFFHPIFNNMLLWTITLAAYGLLSCIVCILAAFYLPNNLIKSLLNFLKLSPTAPSLLWEKTSLKLMLGQLIYLIASAIDLYAVKFFTGKIAIDQYSAILTVVSITPLIASGILSTLVSSTSFYLKNKEYTNLQKKLNHSNITNFIVLSIVTFFIIYFGYPILDLFGPGYATHTSYLTLIILALSYYFSTFCYSAIQLLSYSKNLVWLIYAAIAQIIIVTLFALLLTPGYGIIGAALSSAISLTGSTIFYLYIVRREIGVKSFIFV